MRIEQDADAYKSQTINLAQGDAGKYTAIYNSYAKAPKVTAWRLYLKSVDAMLGKSSRVILDSSGRGVGPLAPYLPLSEIKPSPAHAPAPAAGAGK